MNITEHFNIVSENMIREFLEMVAEECDLDADELIETYINSPKKSPNIIPPYMKWIQETMSGRAQIKGIMDKPDDLERNERCCARVLTEQRISGLNRDQCLKERGSRSLYCSRHQKKRVNGDIYSPVRLMKAHDFKKTKRHFPIVIDGVSFMYEPFSQIARRVIDNKRYFIHSTNGEDVSISGKKRDNCVYIVRWNKKILTKNYGLINEFRWNMTTGTITTMDGNKFGKYLKTNQRCYNLIINQ
jgi:hypothetical protein